MSYAKQKGTAFETSIVKYFTECGFTTARRVPLSGASGDKGDIWLGNNPIKPDVVIECKNYAKELPYKMVEDFVKEAITEYVNATANEQQELDYFKALLIAKRPNLGVTDSWLIIKNSYGITARYRLGDVVNEANFSACSDESSRISVLEMLLSGYKQKESKLP